MYSSSLLQAVTMVAGIAWMGSVGASESRIDLDEFAVSWHGDGHVAIRHTAEGKLWISCQCQGDIQVSNDQLDAQAQQLTYDSARQELVLEGDVKLKVRDTGGQAAVGQIQAQKVTVKAVVDQVLIEVHGAKLQGTVRLRDPKR